MIIYMKVIKMKKIMEIYLKKKFKMGKKMEKVN